LIRGDRLESFSHSRYSVAPLTAVQLNVGVAEVLLPLGPSKVAAPGATRYVTVRVALLVFPAASRAVTVMTVVPDPSGTDAIDHPVTPAAVPLAPRSVLQLTWVTPTLSDAVPLTARLALEAVYVPVLVGDVIAIVGKVVSAVAGTVKARPELQPPATPELNARIHHAAAPLASAMPGLTVQVPVPDAHPAVAAEYVVSSRGCWLASLSHNS
jgi:hypothetical protein